MICYFINYYRSNFSTKYFLKNKKLILYKNKVKYLNMNLKNKTKIIATIGTDNFDKNKLASFIDQGISVFRINSSHSTLELIKINIDNIRYVSKQKKANVCILQDLQGPKIRIGEIENGQVQIIDGQNLTITTKKILGNNKIINTTYSNFTKDIKIGEKILIDDGKIILISKKKEGDTIITKVIHGGILKSRKGINLPNTELSSSSLTSKDRKDLIIGLENNVEWIALSFVRKAEEVKELKDIIKKSGKNTKIISKIEKPEALEDLDNIIEESDAIMVARGDLGVEIPMERVPIIQKDIVRKCNHIGKPVIIATQMMESMIENPTPTRAEINDIANAVIDGADALMLSAETAIGKYPLKVIKKMTETINFAEKQTHLYNKYHNLSKELETYYSDSVVQAACILAEEVNAKAIIGSTASGYTAFEIARNRPKSNIFIFTDNKDLMKTFALVWGVKAFYYNKKHSMNTMFRDMENILIEEDFIKSGDICIHTAALPIDKKQRSNMLKISIA